MTFNKKNLVLLFFILIIIVMAINFILTKQNFLKENTDNIENNTIDFSSLTLKQKIAQMIMVRGDGNQQEFNNLNVGGIFLDRQKSQEEYKNLIEKYQDNSKINLLVATDLEGAWAPFPDLIFPTFSEIETPEQAYEVGLEHGEVLKEVGFNLNFAPISEFADNAYGGRVFLGSKQEIQDKLENYILGLQQNSFGTCKHYPGKAMIRNLHDVTDKQTISKDDLDLFETCITNNISAIMVSHQIVDGELNSNVKPSSVSEEVISNLKDFNGLIIADEINMAGLKKFYTIKTDQYVDLINAGENVILDFKLSPIKLYKLISKIEKEEQIDQNKIDESVRKILLAKGYVLI